MSRFSSWQTENINVFNQKQKESQWDDLLERSEKLGNVPHEQNNHLTSSEVIDELDPVCNFISSGKKKSGEKDGPIEMLDLSSSNPGILNSGDDNIDNIINKYEQILQQPRRPVSKSKTSYDVLAPYQQRSDDSWDNSYIEEKKGLSFVKSTQLTPQLEEEDDIEEVIEIVDVGRKMPNASTSEMDEADDILEEVNYEDDFDGDDLIDDELRKSPAPVS